MRDAVHFYVLAFEQVRSFNQDGPNRDAAEAFAGERSSFGAALVAGVHVADDWDQAMAAAETALPDRLVDRSECPRCPFKKRCNPSQASVDPALLIDDEFLINKIQKHEETREPRKIYERTHKELRERFDMTKGTVFFAGPFRLEKKPHGVSWTLKVTQQVVQPQEATPHAGKHD